MNGRFVRLGETARRPITIFVDGKPVAALEGDTLLTAILCAAAVVRLSEFGDGPRAGFCLMGACQDCWVWTEQGGRLRACSSQATDGMRVRTTQIEATWATIASS